MAKKESERTPLPTIAKIAIFLAGFSNFLLGYALYFVLYDTDEEKAKYFRYGAKTCIILAFVYLIGSFVLALAGVDITSFFDEEAIRILTLR